MARLLAATEGMDPHHGTLLLDAEGQYHDNGLSRVMAFDKLVNPEQSPFFNWSKPFVQLETPAAVSTPAHSV